MRASAYFPGLGLYYSYAACGADEDSWIRHSTIDGWHGRSITVSLKGQDYPQYYKANATCCGGGDAGVGCAIPVAPECLLSRAEALRADSVPWQGTKVDYVKEEIRRLMIRIAWAERDTLNLQTEVAKKQLVIRNWPDDSKEEDRWATVTALCRMAGIDPKKQPSPPPSTLPGRGWTRGWTRKIPTAAGKSRQQRSPSSQ